jgi:hypothetical protein
LIEQREIDMETWEVTFDEKPEAEEFQSAESDGGANVGKIERIASAISS